MAKAYFPWVCKSKKKYNRYKTKKQALAAARRWRKEGIKNVRVYKLKR